MERNGSPALVDAKLFAAAALHPERPAIGDAASGRELTFAQLADGARRVAAGLAEHGAGRGDVVALAAGNSPDYAVALYGALAAGAAVHGVNPALTAGELARQFAQSRPRLAIADEASLAAVAEAVEPGTPVHVGPADLLAAPAPPAGDRDPADLAHLFATSGTSGLPRIAAHTHGGTTAAMRALARVPGMRFGERDVVGIVIPFTHLFGSALLHHNLLGGARVVTLAAFELEAYLQMLQDHAVTIAPVTPPLLAALAHHPLVDRFDLSSLRLIISGAAPCPAELQDRAQERLGCVVGDCLGSTEAWGYAMLATPPVRGSVGRLVPGLEGRIAEPDGELWIRGPQVMRGYLGGGGVDADGWLHTGDVCRFDGAGNLYVVDRLKDLIKVGGCSVAPAEVELELARHPAVADAAVVGRPDAQLGEAPIAYVAVHEPVEPDELRRWLAGRLAPWKQVREVIIVERVARSPVGKLLRRQVAQAVG